MKIRHNHKNAIKAAKYNDKDYTIMYEVYVNDKATDKEFDTEDEAYDYAEKLISKGKSNVKIYKNFYNYNAKSHELSFVDAELCDTISDREVKASTGPMLIRNRKAIEDELTDLLIQFDKDLNDEYATDVYLVYNESDATASLTTVEQGSSKPSGNSYLIYTDDIHDPDDIWDIFVYEEADWLSAFDIDEDTFEDLIRQYFGMKPNDRITVADEINYVKSNPEFMNILKEDYGMALDEMREEYEIKAEEILNQFDAEMNRTYIGSSILNKGVNSMKIRHNHKNAIKSACGKKSVKGGATSRDNVKPLSVGQARVFTYQGDPCVFIGVPEGMIFRWYPDSYGAKSELNYVKNVIKKFPDDWEENLREYGFDTYDESAEYQTWSAKNPVKSSSMKRRVVKASKVMADISSNYYDLIGEPFTKVNQILLNDGYTEEEYGDKSGDVGYVVYRNKYNEVDVTYEWIPGNRRNESRAGRVLDIYVEDEPDEFLDALWEACSDIPQLIDIGYELQNGIIFTFNHTTNDYEARENQLISALENAGFSAEYLGSNGSNVIVLDVKDNGIKSSVQRRAIKADVDIYGLANNIFYESLNRLNSYFTNITTFKATVGDLFGAKHTGFWDGAGQEFMLNLQTLVQNNTNSVLVTDYLQEYLQNPLYLAVINGTTEQYITDYISGEDPNNIDPTVAPGFVDEWQSQFEYDCDNLAYVIADTIAKYLTNFSMIIEDIDADYYLDEAGDVTLVEEDFGDWIIE